MCRLGFAPTDRSDRLSGRSRIETSALLTSGKLRDVAIVFRGDRGLKLCQHLLKLVKIVAIVFRGDRGLKLCQHLLKLVKIVAIVFRGDRGLKLEY